jgi:hypothetical protein
VQVFKTYTFFVEISYQKICILTLFFQKSLHERQFYPKAKLSLGEYWQEERPRDGDEIQRNNLLFNFLA